MPQLPTSSSTTSVPLSYPLYLDLGTCGQLESKSNFECESKPNKSMFDLGLFYENILNKSSIYSLNPQYFAESFNYYLNKTYQNGGQHSSSKSFSIESILGFQENNSSPKDFFVNSISPNYLCNNQSNFKQELLTSSPNCHSVDNDVFDSFTLSNEDYSLKDNCSSGSNVQIGGSIDNHAIRNKSKSYKLNNSKKSSKIHKQIHLHKAANILSAKSKRIRTIFTPEQLERLELEFERQQYMVGTSRLYLASTLNLTEAQVKVWFQNRRIKWRKQHLDEQHDNKGPNQDLDGSTFADMI